MSRLLLLFVCMIWYAGSTEPAVVHRQADAQSLGMFLGVMIALVGLVGSWCRWVARRVSARNFAKSVQRLQWVMLGSRLGLVVWYGVGIFLLGWPNLVLETLGLGRIDHIRLPSLLLGTLPLMAAWVALWWAQFPLDHEIRQQGLTESLLDGLPVHPPPRLGSYLASHLRLQLLFTVLPVMLITGVHDVAALGLLNGMTPPAIGSVQGHGIQEWPAVTETRFGMTYDQVDGLIWFAATGLVFVFSPELLRRILQTSPMPEGPLRRRLESLCRRSGMRVQDILLWHTHYNVGNAAVMGLFPRFRYVLLSDLLLERMEDEQIEAVFAHEVGHVVHRHMAWYLVFFIGMIFASFISMTLLESWARRTWLSAEAWLLISLIGGIGGFWVLFGFLSRRFERQADVYAARIMELNRPADAVAGAAALAPLLGESPADADWAERARPTPVNADSPHVGPYGANLFASALHRVATINNMPVTPRSRRGDGLMHHVGYFLGSLTDLAHDWLHGSIPSRMEYLRSLSDDPTATLRFDRVMGRLYGLLLFLLIASAACFSMLV